MIQSVAKEGSDYGTIGSGGESGGHRNAQTRDEAADQRDHAENQRDQAGNRRDQAGGRRDQAAHQRDLAAERRDLSAELFATQVSAGTTSEAPDRSALARQEAASDRREASLDRWAGADERTGAEHNRGTALRDRSASASERASASLDGLTGVHLRGAGRLELERELARARRTNQPLVLAFVDVDTSRPSTIRALTLPVTGCWPRSPSIKANLRAYDLIVRCGGNEFVCAILGLTLADVAKRFSLINEALAAAPEQALHWSGSPNCNRRNRPKTSSPGRTPRFYRARRRGDSSGGGRPPYSTWAQSPTEH